LFYADARAFAPVRRQSMKQKRLSRMTAKIQILNSNRKLMPTAHFSRAAILVGRMAKFHSSWPTKAL
jgi:hypothetical protein